MLPGRPFAPGPRPPCYTPYFVLADIQRERSPGAVGYGTNVLTAHFQDSLPMSICTFSLVLRPGTWSVDDDLLAYACRGWLMLMTPRGMALPPNSLMISAQSP